MKAAIPLACYNMTAGLSDPTVASDTTQTIKVKLKLVNASSHQISPIHESANIIIDMNKMRISIKRRDYRWNDAYLKVWSSVIFLPIIIKYPTVISRIPLLLFNKGNIKFFFFFLQSAGIKNKKTLWIRDKSQEEISYWDDCSIPSVFILYSE